jgi:hypothetical protein
MFNLAYPDIPMIDEDDLCINLVNNGTICWLSTLDGGSLATDSGASWKIRSWEAQTKSWYILIGSAELEIYTQAQWCCEVR